MKTKNKFIRLCLVSLLVVLTGIFFVACDGLGGDDNPDDNGSGQIEVSVPEFTIELNAKDQKNVAAGTYTIKYKIDNADDLEEIGEVAVSYSVSTAAGEKINCRNGKFTVEPGVTYYATITATVTGMAGEKEFSKTATASIVITGAAGDTTEYSQVSFYSQIGGIADNTAFATQTIEKGTKAKEPSVVPTVAGYEFDYWYYTDPEVPYDFSTPVRYAKMTLMAKWHTIDYVVTFDCDDEEEQNFELIANVLSNYTLNSSDAKIPQKFGYNFDGWYYLQDGEELPFVFADSEDAQATVISGDLTLKAHYAKKHFTLTYYSNGEVVGLDYNADLVYEDELHFADLIALEDYRGYEFAGWAFDQNGEEPFGDGDQALVVTKDVTLFAVWNKIEYAVLFDCGVNDVDGLQNSVKYVTVDDDFKVTPPENFPTLIPGREFDAWYRSGSTDVFDFENTEIDSDVTIVARWNGLPYDVCLKITAEDEAIDGSAIKKIYGSEYVVPNEFAAPIRTGYTFEGWGVLLESEEVEPVEFPYVIKGDTVFVAIWSLIRYSATLNYNDNATEDGIVYTDYTAEYKFAKPQNPSRRGYTFLYWTLNAEGAEEDAFAFSDYVASEDVTLVANWKVITFEVAFDDGTNIIARLPGSVEGVTLPEEPDKEGYSFTGWIYTAADGEKYELTENTEILQSGIVANAVWTLDEYMVAFVVDYKDVDGQDAQANYNAIGTVNGTELPFVEVYGYNLIGWATTAQALDADFTATTKVLSATTVYAVLTKKSFTATIYADESKNAAHFERSAEFLSSITIGELNESETAVIEKEGYDFNSAYYTYVDGEKTIYDFAPITENIKLYVDRTLKTYAVSVHTDIEIDAGEYYEFEVLTDITTGYHLDQDRLLRILVRSDYYTYAFDNDEWYLDSAFEQNVTLYGGVDNIFKYEIKESKDLYVKMLPDQPHFVVYTIAGLTDPTIDAFAGMASYDVDLGLVHYGDFINALLEDEMLPDYTQGELGASFAAEGYTIDGWYFFNGVDATFKLYDKRNEKIDRRFAEKYCYIYLKYTLTEFEVTFDSQGGTEADSVVLSVLDKNGEGKIIIPTPSVTRTGYTLDYWYRKDAYGRVLPEDAASGFDLTQDVKEMVYDTENTDMTLYAHWTAINYSVSLDAGAGFIADAHIGETKGSVNGIQSLPTPVREGYNFVGWFDESDNLVTTDTAVLADVILTAKYELTEYVVTFRYLDGTSVQKTGTINGVELPDEPEEREGYYFDGWIYNSFILRSADQSISADMTMLPNYVKIRYGVTFVTLGSDGNTTAQTVYSDIDNDYLIDQPEIIQKKGYVLEGWFEISGEYNTPSCVYETEFDFISEVKRNVTVYAKLRSSVTSTSGSSDSWIFETKFYDYDVELGEFVETVNGRYIEITGLNESVLTANYPDAQDILVPEKIIGKSVFRIAENAFAPRNGNDSYNAMLAKIKTFTIEVSEMTIGGQRMTTVIGTNAFAYNVDLQSLYLSGNVVATFDESILWNCISLTNIYVDESVYDDYAASEMLERYVDYLNVNGAMSNIWYEYLGIRYLLNSEFAIVKDAVDGPEATYVTLLQSIRGKKVSKIGSFAFIEIGSTMETLTFGAEIEDIAFGAFDSCSDLQAVYITSTDTFIATINSGAFINANPNLVIYVPQSVYYVYKASAVWKDLNVQVAK